MNCLIIGGASFVGTNLALRLIDKKYDVTLVDRNKDYFYDFLIDKTNIVVDPLTKDSDFLSLTKGFDYVFHLVTFSKSVSESIDSKKELEESITFTNNLLNACKENNVKKVLFISSGGTVYGKSENLPLKEDEELLPISAYGNEKVQDERCFFDYIGDYHIFRLSNPYGPYQRVGGAVGAVTKFTYNILNNIEITINGDGSVVRDYIYITDAIDAMLNIMESNTQERIFNIGSGVGINLNELIQTIESVLNTKALIKYNVGRSADVPKNILDVSKYEKQFGKLEKTPLDKGVKLLSDFFKNN